MLESYVPRLPTLQAQRVAIRASLQPYVPACSLRPHAPRSISRGVLAGPSPSPSPSPNPALTLVLTLP